MHINGTYKGASSIPASLLLPSQLDQYNPLHPGNMSSLIRLVSAALEKPQAPCGGEGPEREASVAKRDRPKWSESCGVVKESNCSPQGNVEVMQDNYEEREETWSRRIHSIFQPFNETSTPSQPHLDDFHFFSLF